ncbi:hypothetical protein J1614_001163 [Plenodomus biglobosus]|nr:hypothetical protein J1614_001163 [Plenodomus biglobosus]
MQVFNPCPPASSDGLRPYRHFVYAGAFILPALMASLAFVNTQYGYQSLGAFCMLPIRPFWYRLALQWIPRYLIALVIFALATAIYTYVGFAFRRYSETSQSFRDSLLTSGLSSSREERETESSIFAVPQLPEMVLEKSGKTRRASSVAHEIVSSPRKESSVSFICAGPRPVRAASITPESTYAVPEKPMHAPPRRPSLALIPSGYTIHQISPPGHGHTITPQRPHTNTSASPPPPAQDQQNQDVVEDQTQEPDPLSLPLSPILQPIHPGPSPTSPGQRQMDRQRARVHRQLRLLFIYPLIYTLMWILPFAMHCMNYQDRYALRPVWFIRLSSNILITSIGFVNFVVFTAREKPWKSISTSDGTLWGSFAVWKGRSGTRVGSLVSGAGARARASVQRSVSEDVGARPGARVRGSTSDAAKVAMGQARVRLELEREERFEAMRTRVAGREGVASGDESGFDDGVVGVGAGEGKGKERAVDGDMV